ncbi:hypothetical protein [Pseudoalteromonas marina]|uniref:hypothetical protein n=1 Tax=Pseudoalteromonas marina TaxID=267375 RepID=UPI003C61CC20
METPKIIDSLTAEFEKTYSPEAAMAEFEYLEYLERQGQKVCQIEKAALGNIASLGDWNRT